MTLPRSALVFWVKLLFGFLIAAFFFALLSSLRGPSLTIDSPKLFDDVELGETAMRRLDGKRVWVTRWTKQLVYELKQLDSYVQDESNCDLGVQLCVLSSETSRDGIEIRFVLSKPEALDKSQKWFGGFVDPVTGSVYDRAGRSYNGQQLSQSLLSIAID